MAVVCRGKERCWTEGAMAAAERRVGMEQRSMTADLEMEPRVDKRDNRRAWMERWKAGREL